ncbi:MAG: hypothetical protein LC117_10990 [Bacteroidia bacterium]|nr:hypothetical protein [Bacteroidia bacterium]MCZ2278441.1 hypothetical protein [Bacteroidia bacterium]
MSRLIYLTYADQPSGVYSSQVCDVVNYLNQQLNAEVRLVSFVSLRRFSASKQKIKSEVNDAIVLPMLPKANYWKCSLPLLLLVCLMTGCRSILGRGVLATNLALLCRKWGIIKKAGYDGRGAIAAEWSEYEVVPYFNLKNSIDQLEKRAVLESDYRIAVSEKLVDYWRDRYSYSANHHVVIPCLLNSSFGFLHLNRLERKAIRLKSGIKEDATVLAYSGSVSGWQSFGLVKQSLEPLLRKNKNTVLLFMSAADNHIDQLLQEFPGQVFRIWVKHQEVSSLLAACDFGILIRNHSVTNQVASPTKFAEYLGAGLPVLISEGIGDYTDFVRKHQCGMVLSPGEIVSSLPATRPLPDFLHKLVKTHFTKESQTPQYLNLLAGLNI